MKIKDVFFGGIIALLFIVVILGIIYLVIISGAIFSLAPNPPKPEIEYGEFPIKVTFEIDGEIRTVEDIVVCEFDGYENLGSAGKNRKWKAHLKSGKRRFSILNKNANEKTFELYMFYGFPEYYMGDFKQSKEEYERQMADDRTLGYIQWENDVQSGCSISKEEVWEKYKLKIIDIEYSLPIQNSFEE